MIVSASRRTDIPAFYAKWMVNRLREGYCTVPNPFNRRQVSRIELTPSNVEVIVFWTRNVKPLRPHLSEIDALGFRYYFQFTILGYPRVIDTKSPSLGSSLAAFKDLADFVGPCRVVWRYDPIVFTVKTPAEYHRRRFEEIAAGLAGSTERVVVSIVDPYRKSEARMQALDANGAGLRECAPLEFERLMRDLAEIARSNGMEIVSCAEEIALTQYGIGPGRCVDDGLIERAFGIDVSRRKDPSQRSACECRQSRDIGMYDSCLFGCPYCYATKSFRLAQEHYAQHDPQSPSLLGWHEPSGTKSPKSNAGNAD